MAFNWVPVIEFLITRLSDLATRYRRDVKAVQSYFQSAPFLAETFIKDMLWNFDFTTKVRTKWIDYGAWTKYYASDRKRFKIEKSTRDPKDIELPYSEVLRWAERPQARVLVNGLIDEFQMSSEMLAKTERNLYDFLKDKPDTKDNPILRVADLKKDEQGSTVQVRLQRSRYFDQVRTNLTLDYPLTDGIQTLRALDLSEDKNLPPLNQSCLVNSLGVSAIVWIHQGDKKLFFTKVRKPSEGVFERMLGTVSGVVEPPTGRPMTDLLEYAKEEISREMTAETGIGQNHVERIIPLALCRELTRGGKPQFFFSIQLRDLEPEDAYECFRNSIEGLDEFYDGYLANATITRHALSPEFAANLLYFLRLHRLCPSPSRRHRPLWLAGTLDIRMEYCSAWRRYSLSCAPLSAFAASLVRSWAEQWVMAKDPDVQDGTAWRALTALAGADLISTDRPYLYGREDFWRG